MSEEIDGQVIHREFAADLEVAGDGRTVDVRIVPYNIKQRVSDPPERGGTGIPYYEMWVPKAFEDQTTAAHRLKVLANVEHQPGIGGVVARGLELRETRDALEGTFRMLSVPDSDKTLELINEGVFSGVSLEAKPKKTIRDGDVVKRVKAHLEGVAFCRSPAYPQAEVLAVREQSVEPATPKFEPSSEVDERLQRLGFETILSRAVVKTSWDGSPARFTDDQYKRSCLIDRGGDAPVKQRCSLPVLEPNGDLNANALGAAAAALSGARGGLRGVSSAQKAAAARKLIRYYGQADMEPPPSLRAIAAR
jgi:HK97 family phage prohead protease